MGRTGTWLLVAAVGVLAVAATVDAVRGRGGEQASEPPATTTEPARRRGPEGEAWRRSAGERLRVRGVRGELLWVDAECRLSALALPALADVASVRGSACEFTTSPGGTFAANRLVVSPNGRATASCTGGEVEVRGPADALMGFRGCAPAWTPDGRLTLVRDGGLVAVPARCVDEGTCARPVLSRADLRRVFGRVPWELREPVLKEVAWLSEETYAAIVSDRATRQDLIAVMRGRSLVTAPPFGYDLLTDLRASPRGTYAAALINRRALVFVDNRGRYQASGLRSAHAVTWSPDEQWTAAATDEGIYVYETATRAAELIRLPIIASDLVWRPR